MELVSGRQSYDLTSLLSLTASPNLRLIKTVNCVSVVHHPSSCNVLFQRKYLFEIKAFEMCLWRFEYKHSFCAAYRRLWRS